MMARTEDVNHLMVEECTAEYMAKMSKKNECVRHLAFLAPPAVSVVQLSQACDRINAEFTVEDARELCSGLNAVHAGFWPRFTH